MSKRSISRLKIKDNSDSDKMSSASKMLSTKRIALKDKSIKSSEDDVSESSHLSYLSKNSAIPSKIVKPKIIEPKSTKKSKPKDGESKFAEISTTLNPNKKRPSIIIDNSGFNLPNNIIQNGSVNNLTITSESGSEEYNFMNKRKESDLKFVDSYSTPKHKKEISESENLSFDLSDENNLGPLPPPRRDGKFLKRTHYDKAIERYWRNYPGKVIDLRERLNAARLNTQKSVRINDEVK